MPVYYAEITQATGDPKNLNRKKVWVPDVHGQDHDERLLPWAYVGSAGGGMPDTGRVDKYDKGASVYVVFENNNLAHPVILFGVPKRIADFHKYGACDWVADSSATTDVPIEALDEETTVAVKTPKGATLYIKEAHEQETLILIDRAGQLLEMHSPVTEVANACNDARRGVSSAVDGTALAYSQMAGPAYIRLIDLSGNKFLLHSEEGEEKVEIENEVHGNKIEMTKDGVTVTVLGGQSSGGLTIVASAEGLKVNGQYLATESLVDWLGAYKKTLVQSTRPGDPAPLYPTAKTEFDANKDASVNGDGHKTRLM